jgi:hypothetical protein
MKTIHEIIATFILMALVGILAFGILVPFMAASEEGAPWYYWLAPPIGVIGSILIRGYIERAYSEKEDEK